LQSSLFNRNLLRKMGKNLLRVKWLTTSLKYSFEMEVWEFFNQHLIVCIFWSVCIMYSCSLFIFLFLFRITSERSTRTKYTREDTTKFIVPNFWEFPINKKWRKCFNINGINSTSTSSPTSTNSYVKSTKCLNNI